MDSPEPVPPFNGRGFNLKLLATGIPGRCREWLGARPAGPSPAQARSLKQP
jgi:hypothetical protein